MNLRFHFNDRILRTIVLCKRRHATATSRVHSFPASSKPAGEKASFGDAAYVAAGATVVSSEDVYDVADILTKIRPPDDDELPKLAGKTLVGMVSPGINTDLYDSLVAQKTNVFALDCVPRMLSRAQSYDVLSSQANIAGYRSVVEAANRFPRFFAGQMTAAGKVPPAKVLVLGVGVAGLAAIQTAKNMGAIVRAFDVRSVTKEQVESMGATFLEVDLEEDGAGAGGYAKVSSTVGIHRFRGGPVELCGGPRPRPGRGRDPTSCTILRGQRRSTWRRTGLVHKTCPHMSCAQDVLPVLHSHTASPARRRRKCPMNTRRRRPR